MMRKYHFEKYMKNIIVKLDKNFNFITDSLEHFYIQQILKIDKEYEVKIIKSRNIKHHKKYWSLMHALAFHFGNTPETWHIHYKAKFLPLEEFKLPSGKKILYPSSTAFDKMTQIEFDDYYNRINLFLVEQGYNIDELIETST